jgi:RNA polymerase sigma-70 factor (ECF subfamily)
VLSDEALMAAYASRGDEAAFDELFRRYAPLLGRVMRVRVSSHSDAQDLVQQTFLQVHRARADFRAEMRFRPWFFTIAFNLLREMHRRKRARPVLLELRPGEDTVCTDDPRAGGEVEEVRRALATLPLETREVIALHWLEGLPFSEVALRVGASLSAVKVRAHRGYALLRQHLGKDS